MLTTAKDSFYSELKAAWHTDRIAELREGRPVRPVEMQLIIADLCNADCAFCAYRMTAGLSSELFGVKNKDGSINHNPNRTIEYEKAIEIIEDAHRIGYKSIIFTGGGEPTVHREYLSIFNHALSFGIDCSLNTNGVRLVAGWEDVLSRFAYVRFSIDAGNAEDYARVRRVTPETYGRAIANLEEMVNAAEYAKLGCVVGAGFVLTADVARNFVDGCRRLRDTGIRYVRVASMQSTAGKASYGAGEWDYCRAEIATAKRLLETEQFKIVDLFDSAMGPRPDYQPCHFQRFVTYVGADLNIYRCCYTAYTTLGQHASIKDRSLLDWWKDPATHADFAEFDARSCATCPLDGKNRVLNYLADAKPAHVNFL